ncbi:MAG: hypothetical protein ACYC4P_11670 [Thermoanaerobaculia bacterium]
MATTGPTGWNPTPAETKKLVLVAGRIAKGGADPIEFLERLFPFSSETFYRRAVTALPAYPVNDLYAMREIDERFGDFVESVAHTRSLNSLGEDDLAKVLGALPKFVDRCRGIRFALRAPAFTGAIDALTLRVLRDEAGSAEREALETLARLLVPSGRRLRRAKELRAERIMVVVKPLGARLLAAAKAIAGVHGTATRRARLLKTALPHTYRPGVCLAPTEEEADEILAAITRARAEKRTGPLSPEVLVRAMAQPNAPIGTLAAAREAARQAKARKGRKGKGRTRTP